MSKISRYIRSLRLDYDKPIYIHVTGKPNTGKTTLSIILYETLTKERVNNHDEFFSKIAMKDNSSDFVNFLSTDTFVNKVVSLDAIKYDKSNAKLQIGENFSRFEERERALFNELLRNSTSEKNKFIIVEGYCPFDEENFFKSRNVIKIKLLKRGKIILGNADGLASAFLRGASMRAETTGERWEVFKDRNAFEPVTRFARQLFDEIAKDVTERVVNPICKYQYFEDFMKAPKVNSRSREKFERLSLDAEEISSWTNVLDVGCNCGYISTRLCNNGASGVVGLDLDRNFIRCASAISSYIYHFSDEKCKFFTGDIFDYLGNCKSQQDAIIACSVFHYFRAAQFDFIKLMRSVLKDSGLIVLETGVSDQNPGQPYVQEYAREVDGGNPCMFPNLAWYEQAGKELGLTITHFGDSVDQRGDAIPRKVIHLRPGQS